MRTLGNRSQSLRTSAVELKTQNADIILAEEGSFCKPKSGSRRTTGRGSFHFSAGPPHFCRGSSFREKTAPAPVGRRVVSSFEPMFNAIIAAHRVRVQRSGISEIEHWIAHEPRLNSGLEGEK